jgi:hypothetical protein
MGFRPSISLIEEVWVDHHDVLMISILSAVMVLGRHLMTTEDTRFIVRGNLIILIVVKYF